MSTALQPSLWDQVQKSRETVKDKIQAFFEANLGKKFSSKWLHGQWGSSFRTRVSDINLDKFGPIFIKNAVTWNEISQREESMYWAVTR